MLSKVLIEQQSLVMSVKMEPLNANLGSNVTRFCCIVLS